MPAPPPSQSNGSGPAKAAPAQPIPAADEKAARTAISQLWKPVASSSAGLTPPQQRWLGKLERACPAAGVA
eukprot:304042-Alexandrium_andersonii.AAC.1